MRNNSIKSLATLAVLSAVCLSAAQTTIIRHQFTPGGAPYDTAAYLTDSIEFWGFGFNTNNPDYEVGRLWPVAGNSHGFLLVGGYATLWPTTHNVFGVPFALFSYTQGNLTLKGSMGAYVPVGHGPRSLFSDEISLTVPTRKGTFGVGSSFGAWQGSDFAISFGPTATFTLDKNTTLEARCFFDKDGHPSGRIGVVFHK